MTVPAPAVAWHKLLQASALAGPIGETVGIDSSYFEAIAPRKGLTGSQNAGHRHLARWQDDQGMASGTDLVGRPIALLPDARQHRQHPRGTDARRSRGKRSIAVRG